MITFKTGKTHQRNYYALRIFVLVHLFIAIAISVAVFITGPNDVIRLMTVGVFLFLLPITALLGFQLYRTAAGKDLYGYFVLTKNTLVVKRPGMQRQFLRRADCTGFTSQPWKLTFRDKQVLTLSGPGMGHDYRRELGETVVRTWWPKFHQGPVAALVVGDDGYKESGPFEIRAIFRPGDDREFPILAYGPSEAASTWWFFGIIRSLFVVAFSVLVLSQSFRFLTGEHDPLTKWNAGLAATTSIVIVLLFGALGGRAIWQTARERIPGRIFLLSRRGMKILHPGHGWHSLRLEGLVDYAPETGLLRTTDKKEIRFAMPLSRQGAYSRLVYTSLVYWGVERRSDWDKYLPGGDSIVGEGTFYCSMLLGSVLFAVANCFADPGSWSLLGMDQRMTFGILLLCGTLAIIACLLLAIYVAHARAPIPLGTTAENDKTVDSRSTG